MKQIGTDLLINTLLYLFPRELHSVVDYQHCSLAMQNEVKSERSQRKKGQVSNY